MQYSILSLGLAALAVAAPQGVTTNIAPSGSAPAGCSPDYSGSFEIEVLNVTSSKRSLNKRDALVVTLAGGVLTDNQGRTGYIAANQQFQFDKPAQTGAVYTSGWSACQNGSLALGSSAIFYQCLSGTFYNLYDADVADQCSPVYIDILSTGSSAATAPASVIGDGQVTASPVTQIGDGQIQGPTGQPVTQISDGQIQATTAAGGAPVTQISDGQIQATTKAGNPVTQISDGQIQGPTGQPVTQITDGQIQAPTGQPVTQITDGQIQAPTGTPVTQISDGQVQAPTGAPITNGTSPAKPTPQTPNTNAAAGSFVRAESFGLAALVFAVALL